MPPRVRVLLALCASALLGACDDAPPASTETPKPAASAAAPDQAGTLPADMVAAVAAGKTATAVSVHFALRAAPQVGRPLPVDIAVVPLRKLDSVSARFEPQGGLTMSSGNDLPAQTNATPDRILTHRLMLQPTGEGLFMVTATVNTLDQEGSVSRVFYIPVLVNPGAAPAAPAAAAPAPAAGTPPATG